MATKWKGKFRGPDAFKGDKDTLAAWRKAGRPKNIDEFLKGYNASKPAFKGKYPGPDEFQGDESAITGWKASGKDKLYVDAWGLGKSKYAPALSELDTGLKTNTDLYTNASNQRKAALDREIGSINAAGATGRTRIGATGEANQSMYQQAMAQSQTQTKDLLSAVGKNNSDMLSSMQAEIKARGGSPEDYAYLSPLTRNASQTNSNVAAVGELNRGALDRQAGIDRMMTGALQESASMLATTGASKARGQGQADFNDLYTRWLEQKNTLEGKKTATGLEQRDYTNQLYQTLKEKREAEKAAAAQAALQAKIASGNLNYKYEALKVGTQYKYDKLAADKAQNDIANKFKAAGFSHRKSMDLAKFALDQAKYGLDVKKFDWKKANPGGSNANATLADIIASMQ